MRHLFLLLLLISTSITWSQETPSEADSSKRFIIKDPNVYYEINAINHPENLDIHFLIALFNEYPHIKIEYSQTISKNEKTEIAKKRMIEFQLALEKNDVPVSTIIFSNKVYYLDESEPDQRARIQGIVIGLD